MSPIDDNFTDDVMTTTRLNEGMEDIGLSDTQERTINMVSALSGGLSVCGSLTLLYVMSWRKQHNKIRRFDSHHRFLIGLSIFDFISSTRIAVTPNWDSRVPSPTCTFMGFLTVLNYISPLYSIVLSFYFVMTIRYKISRQKFADRYEFPFHIFAAGYPLTVALVAILLKMMNPNSLFTGCTIDAYPPGCDPSLLVSSSSYEDNENGGGDGGIFSNNAGGSDNIMGRGGENDMTSSATVVVDGMAVPCTRGAQASWYLNITFVPVIFIGYTIMLINHCLLYRHVKKIELESNEHQPVDATTATTTTDNNNTNATPTNFTNTYNNTNRNNPISTNIETMTISTVISGRSNVGSDLEGGSFFGSDDRTRGTSVSRSNRSRTSRNRRRRRINLEKTQWVAKQCSLYIVSMLLCYIWPPVLVIVSTIDPVGAKNGDYFYVQLLMSIFFPLQGFLNAIIFTI